MAVRPSFRPATGEIPDLPGVYRFVDAHGRVIYVGKAKSLRSRLTSYFAEPHTLHQRTRTMVATAAGLDWTVVANEVEALQLEYTWIKHYEPRFNVRYRDDKSYPYLAITVGDPFPRVTVMRGAKRPGVRYFGPYSHAWAIRETVDLLLRVFPVRTCSNGVFRRAGQVGRPCLLGYIDKCSAPCVARISQDEHRVLVDDFIAFLEGRADPLIGRLRQQMLDASADEDFERAARRRDDIAALERALERNTMVLPDGTDVDIIGMAAEPLEAAVQVFYVRGGRVRGEHGFVVDRVDDVDESALIERLLQQLYGSSEGSEVPHEVLVPMLPPEPEVAELWLSERRGSRVRLRVPVRGDKRVLGDTVGANARQLLAQHKLKRAGDLSTRALALEEVQSALSLPEAPLRIECLDISHLQGIDVVGSLVVFEDALPRTSHYKRFAIKGFEGSDDVRAIHEVVTRRFRRYLDEQVAATDPELLAEGSATRPSFAYPPQLLLVDGGAPQVAAAARALMELGIDDISVAGLAKRLEEVWLPGNPDPVLLPRTSEGLYLLQRIRDEAHRFALAYQKQKRSKRLVDSLLDEVPGLGDVRRKALLRRFGSLKALRVASLEEIAEVPGIGPRTAVSIRDVLDANQSASAVNVTTGEILGEDGAS